MFRVHFSPQIGMFLLQVLHLGVWWSTVCCRAVDSDGGKALAFNTYDDAMKHATQIGLTKLYENKSANTKPGYDRALQS